MSSERAIDQYVDLEDELPQYECSSCGWLHDEEEAWGLAHDSDRFNCPRCRTLINYSEEVRNPDHDPNRFTGFSGRKVRVGGTEAMSR